ncbi:hypothetical protein ScPMuIL_017208 [Solemya velum]
MKDYTEPVNAKNEQFHMSDVTERKKGGKGNQDGDGDTKSERAAWSNHVEFILTVVGFAVGLGNVWRFPYLCYKNGGGAFLIPYVICLVIMGLPLFFMELAVGQFASLGPIKIWKINPAMKGLGFAMIIITFFICLYYSVVIAYCFFYFFASMTSELPWSTCDNEWNTCSCRVGVVNNNITDPWNGTKLECVNYTATNVTTASEEYFNNHVLEMSDGMGNSGHVKWELTLCNLLVWVIVFIVLSKGIKSLGKVVYFTAIFPYVLLTAMLVRGLTLDGHEIGVDFYITPDLSKITEAQVWSDAAVQIFYSLGTCSGGLIALASYNNFRNNFMRDSFLVPLINCGTSIFAGFAIFSVLGFMSHQTGKSMKDVATDGPGLTFVVYPEGLAHMPIAPLWSILFFFMMITLGFSSQFSMAEAVMTGLIDEFKSTLSTKWRIVGFRLVVCVVGFFLGLPMTTNGGMYILHLMNTYVGGFPLLFVGFVEIVAIVFIYGFMRFTKDIQMMMGSSIIVNAVLIYFGICLCVVTPICLLLTIVFTALQTKPLTYEDYIYPDWGNALGWLMVATPIIIVPVWFLVYLGWNGGGKVSRFTTVYLQANNTQVQPPDFNSIEHISEEWDIRVMQRQPQPQTRPQLADYEMGLYSRNRSKRAYKTNLFHSTPLHAGVMEGIHIPGKNKRGGWSNQLEFILTIVGFAVGLGNVWRFPYLCYKNGGGVFLIPYFVCLVAIGIPIFYLEVAFGQFASLGPLKIWSVNPAFKGLGVAMIVVSIHKSLYYNIVIAQCLYYLFASMTSSLPWVDCHNDWNTCECRDSTFNINLTDPWDGTRSACINYTITTNGTTPTEEYYNNKVLEMSTGIEVSGGLVWQLSLCYLLAFVIIFFAIAKGVKSLGKVVYFTAIFPYILLTVMLVRGLTLEGHEEGITYYLTPDWEKITEAEVWNEAAVQIFFSLSACGGGLIAMASYNKFDSNALRDSIVVPVINCLTSFYAGFAVFSVLGFMAKKTGKTVAQVATDGPGLIFVVYPEALANMPVAPLWSILFFLMMVTLGFSSAFATAETIITGIIDEFPRFFQSRARQIGFRFLYCMATFLLGLPMTTRGGLYIMNLMDTFVGGLPLLVIGFFEIVSIIYIYGVRNFHNDIQMMYGKDIKRTLLPTMSKIVNFGYFIPFWVIVVPCGILAVIVMRVMQNKPLSLGSYHYPEWGYALGWLIVASVVIWIPAWFVCYICARGGGVLLGKLNTPKTSWGPAKPEDRTGYYDLPDYDTLFRTNKPMVKIVDSGLENIGYVPCQDNLTRF